MLEALLQSAAGASIFHERQRVQSMLDFEAALARAEAQTGVIPTSAAEAIGACCKAELFDREKLVKGAASSGNLAIPMVKQLTALVSARLPEAGGYVHWGATSQDVIDTGLLLQLRAFLDVLEDELIEVCDALAALTTKHRATPMVGRTWMQHAVPITFGLKTASWLDAMLRHRERLAELRPRLLVLQFGGAAGTLASMYGSGRKVALALAEELQLPLPSLPWHATRDRIAEAATFHGLIMGTLGKIARDLSLMMQTEVGEAMEPVAAGRGGSSTMPHKRNPVATTAILSSAIRVPGLVGTILSAMVQEHERGVGGWHAEWDTLPEICVLTLGALEKLNVVLKGIHIFADAMRVNLYRTNGLILAEAVSMELAKTMGHDQAHKRVEAAALRAVAEKKHLRQIIQASPVLMKHLTPAKLDALFDPANYIGESQQMIDCVLQAYKAVSTRK